VYRIIGADQKEYGPISAEQIRQWFAEGRLNRASAVRPESETNWKTLGTLTDFSDLFPPPAATISSAPGVAQNCAMATWALVCGALGIVTCVTAPVGLVLGLIAHSRIRASNGRLTGSGLATAGIVLSLITTLIVISLGVVAIPAMLLPALAKAKQKAQAIHCMNNVKQLSLAVMMYAGDNTNRFPSATTWCDSIQSYLGGSTKPFQCPGGDQNQRCHYAFNAKLDGLETTRVENPSATVVFLETDGGWNLSGGPELMLKSSHHGRMFVVGFADGHVEQVSESRLNQLNWNP